VVVQIFQDNGCLFQLSEKPDGTIETEQIEKYKRGTNSLKFYCNDNISAIWSTLNLTNAHIQCLRIGGTNTDTTQGQDVSFFKEGITGRITSSHVFDDGILAVIFGDLEEILWLKSDPFGKIEKVKHLEIIAPRFQKLKCTECDEDNRWEDIRPTGKRTTTHTGSDSFVSKIHNNPCVHCDAWGGYDFDTYSVVNSSDFTADLLFDHQVTKRLSGTSESLEFEIGSLGPLKFTRIWKPELYKRSKAEFIYQCQSPMLRKIISSNARKGNGISDRSIIAITQAHSQGLKSNSRSSSHSLKPSLEQRVANLESTIQDLHATLNEIMSNLNK